MNKHIKAFIYVTPIVLLLSSLFYLSDINFLFNKFDYKDYLLMLLQVSLPVTSMLLINIYMDYKAQKNRKNDDVLA